MQLRRVLFFYCIAAVVVLLVLAWYLITSAARIGADLARSEEAVVPVEEEATELRRAVAELEEDQRRRRADLTPGEAIELSMQIQLVQLDRNEVERELSELTSQRDAYQTEYEARQLRLVPVLGLLLLHGIGIFLFNPRGREEAEPRRKRTKPRRH